MTEIEQLLARMRENIAKQEELQKKGIEAQRAKESAEILYRDEEYKYKQLEAELKQKLKKELRSPQPPQV